MNSAGRECRKFLKRHSEAFFIIGFIIGDCLLSGWLLSVASVAAIIWVCAPAIQDLIKLSAAGQTTYLKAFVKTPKVQRLGLLLFWVYAIRWLLSSVADANLFTVAPSHQPVSLVGAFIEGAQQFAPISFLGTPLLIYLGACSAAILLRSRLKATKQDPDLVAQRQRWSGASYALFSAAFVSSILSITLNENGPAYMLSNWFLASAKDANLFGDADLSSIQPFDTFIIASLSTMFFVLLLQPALRLSALLTSFCWRVVSPKSIQNLIEGFLESLQLPKRVLQFKERSSFATNAARTLVWLLACYAGLLWFFGFCGGPLGYAIQSWMLASAVDAGFAPSDAVPDWMFQPSFRIFLGSIVALYGTAPMSVMGAVLLPYARPRKIHINCDGLLFAQGPYIGLWGRQFRLWSDLESITVTMLKSSSRETLKPQFQLAFRSGGSVSFDKSQISPRDLSVLLDAVDQYANGCSIDPEVFSICRSWLDTDTDGATTDGITHTAVANIRTQEFKSTVFVPFAAGQFLPNTRTRIIKQLASKPLCAVYLAREEGGRMVTVKQFYLADENDETEAITKIFKREYELLSVLDHHGIAKVIDSFTHDKSTYLLIEHRLGIDLRAIVNEHGPRSESLTVAWAKQLCEIMIYLHSREPAILHRDLTPDNVIAGDDGQLRLIDFGAARQFIENITGTMIGKHCYVAPEQLRGEASKQSDIYTFGGTLFFLLTGRDPVALSTSCPAKNIDCSNELDQLVSDCTQFDEQNRPESFEIILKRLQQLDRGVKLKVPAVKEGAIA